MNKTSKYLVAMFSLCLLGCSNPEKTQFTTLFCRGPQECNDHKTDARFSVDKDKNMVVIKYHNKGKVFNTQFLKDCLILDSANWECTSVNQTLGYSFKIKRIGDVIQTTDENIKFQKVN